MDPADAPPNLVAAVARVWELGWQPAEILREARRSFGPLAHEVCRAAVLADWRARPAGSLHPAWVSHLEGLDLAAPSRARGTELERHRAVRVVHLMLEHLGSLEVLLPTPGGRWPTRSADGSATTADPVLEKVRRLLAKAESTTFPAEAEAFTAKAHELMSQHSLDAALAWERHARSDAPVAMRLPIDDPYAGPKAHLLHVVARRSRCRSVEQSHYGLCTVVGFAADLAAVELLFTSLLVQAQAALAAEERVSPPGSRVRSRGFRSSFLRAFAVRIDQRLAEVSRTVDEAGALEHGSALAPALAARSAALDTALAEMFDRITVKRVSVPTDGLGWQRGTEAADRARLRPDLPA